MTIINNLPAYASEHRFIVAREVDGEYWFWGAYDDEYASERAAMDVDGVVFDN